MNKKVTVEDYRRGIKMLKESGITVFAAFVIGFPGETEQTINDNIAFIKETGLDYYSLKEFYYTHTAPIHKLKDQWNLIGQGNVWSHKTMTSQEASAHKLRMFEEVTTSVHVDSDSGLWYLAYLRERGFKWDEIRDIQNLISNMMHKDNKDDFYDKSKDEEGLRSLLTAANFKGKPALHG